MKIAVLISRYHSIVAEGLLWACQNYLAQQKITLGPEDIFEAPGAFEIPLLAEKLAASGHYDGVVCLGCVIKGETAHFEYISQAVSHGLQSTALKTGVPIAFGILTAYTEEQARARSLIDPSGQDNKGMEAARSCVESVRALKKISALTVQRDA